MTEQHLDALRGDLEDLRAGEGKYRFLLDTMQTLVLALNQDWTIFYCNEAFARFVDRPVSELEGQNILELLPAFTQAQPYPAYVQVLETGEMAEVVGLVGSRHLHTKVYPAPWGILSLAQDVTDQKEAEKDLRLTNVLTSLLDQIEIALWELDTEYRIVSMNHWAHEIYGEDVLGKFCYEVASGTDRICANCPAKLVYDGASSGRSEHRRVRKDGRVIYIDHIATPIKDERGDLTGVLVLIIDITQHKKAQEELRGALQEQTRLREEIIAAQQRIISELSTPVIPVLEGILVVPLVGTLDAERAHRVTETLLAEIGRSSAHIVILDITGVPVVDTSVANALLQAATATRLLGAEAILVGIPPAVAQTIVQLGVNLSTLTTRSDLQSGVEYALRRMGRVISDRA